MSAVAQACQQALTAISHAKSLFSSDPLPPTGAVNGANTLQVAHKSATDAPAKAADLSGETIDGYRQFATAAAPPLSSSAKNDARLGDLLQQAGHITRDSSAKLDALYKKVQETSQRAAGATSGPVQRAALAELSSYIRQANDVVKAASTGANGIQGQIRGLQYPGDKPAGSDGDSGGPHIQMVDDKTGGGKELPHGHDPRYWIDVTKIINVPDGQLAPSGTTQIGPNMYYPSPGTPGFATPAPPVAKYPLDLNDIQHYDPSKTLPDYNHSSVAPGWAYPRPNPWQPEPPWTFQTQRPVDIRDIMEVPPGGLAPWGYTEYAPGWWAPDVSKFGAPN